MMPETARTIARAARAEWEVRRLELWLTFMLREKRTAAQYRRLIEEARAGVPAPEERGA